MFRKSKEEMVEHREKYRAAQKGYKERRKAFGIHRHFFFGVLLAVMLTMVSYAVNILLVLHDFLPFALLPVLILGLFKFGGGLDVVIPTDDQEQRAKKFLLFIIILAILMTMIKGYVVSELGWDAKGLNPGVLVWILLGMGMLNYGKLIHPNFEELYCKADRSFSKMMKSWMGFFLLMWGAFFALTQLNVTGTSIGTVGLFAFGFCGFILLFAAIVAYNLKKHQHIQNMNKAFGGFAFLVSFSAWVYSLAVLTKSGVKVTDGIESASIIAHSGTIAFYSFFFCLFLWAFVLMAPKLEEEKA